MEAVVDGNVVRILSRLIADREQYKSTVEAAKAYRELTQLLINRDRPGDHNQAMMELGATVCLKHNPQCLLCPVNELCKARSQGIESELPRFQKRKSEKQTVDRAWIMSSQGILVHRIPDSANRMKGLHEIPTFQQLGINAGRVSPSSKRNALSQSTESPNGFSGSTRRSSTALNSVPTCYGCILRISTIYPSPDPIENGSENC